MEKSRNEPRENTVPTAKQEKPKEVVADREGAIRKDFEEFSGLILDEEYAEDYLEAMMGYSYQLLPTLDPKMQEEFKVLEKQAAAQQPLQGVTDIMMFLRKANPGRNPFDATMEYWENEAAQEHLQSLESFSKEAPSPADIQRSFGRKETVEKVGKAYRSLRKAHQRKHTA